MAYEYILGTALITFCLMYLATKLKNPHLQMATTFMSFLFVLFTLSLLLDAVGTGLHDLIGTAMMGIYAIMFIVLAFYFIKIMLEAFDMWKKKNWWEK